MSASVGQLYGQETLTGHGGGAPPPTLTFWADGAPDSQPSMSERHRRASSNIRRHLLRSTFRVCTLLAADLTAYASIRLLLGIVREQPLLGPRLLTFVTTYLPKGYLGGAQFAVALVIGLAVTGNYGAGDRRRDVTRLFFACALATAVSLWSDLWNTPILVIDQYAITLILLTPALVANRLFLDLVLRRYGVAPKAAARAILVGPGADCLAMVGRPALRDGNGFEIVGFVDTEAPPCAGASGTLQQFDRILHEKSVETVICCGEPNEQALAMVIKKTIAAECQMLAASRTLEFAGVHPEMVWRRGQPFIELRAEALRGRQLILKRLLDIVGSGIALIVFAPLIALIAITVRLDSRGPIIFGQARVGRRGRVFRCLKFRSMHINAEQILRADTALYAEYVKNDFKLPEAADTRITRVGRILRRTSLDELPQLWNVLRGDMSLVGPRPVVHDELRHYDNEEPLLLSLRPGMTGAWQVSGRSSLTYPRRADIELEYVQAWTLAKDIRILFRTVPAVLSQRGAH